MKKIKPIRSEASKKLMNLIEYFRPGKVDGFPEQCSEDDFIKILVISKSLCFIINQSDARAILADTKNEIEGDYKKMLL
ncbi:MAG: hypothetical protein WCQ95_01345 [Bacteroidota bacterium]